MTKLIAVLVIYMYVAVPVIYSDADCKPGWERYGKHCYIMVDDDMEKSVYFTASGKCSKLNARLLEITDESENEWIMSTFRSKTEEFWMSAQKLSGSWKWMSSGNDVKYQNWLPGQPSSDLSKMCATFSLPNGGKWNTANCFEDKMSFICETKDKDQWEIYGRKYHIIPRLMTFDNAKLREEICSLNGAYVLSIESADEMKYIKKYLKKAVPAGGYFWLGATDKLREGQFVWEQRGNTPLTYTYWMKNEPRDINGREDCTQMNMNYEDGRWNDIPCDDKYMVICEKDVDFNFL